MPRFLIHTLLVLFMAIAAVNGYELLSSSSSTAASSVDHPRIEDRPALGEANLDPALLDALRAATNDAARDGVDVLVTSGWRSPEHQEKLLREAVLNFGSEEEAARWVATPETSPHVSGDAIDVGPDAAVAWLSAHGAAYGLCQIYDNEPWHYELRLEAFDEGCPPTYPDPTYDPRMEQ